MSGDPNLGILVHGSNHFIVRGPLPDRETALGLARYWTIIQIGGATPEFARAWTISTKEFREDLSWAVIVPANEDMSAGVVQLLEELRARKIRVHNANSDVW